MKKVVSIIAVLVFGLSSMVFGAGGDLGAGAGADGSEGNPWLIEDFADFEAFCGDTDKWATGVYAKLTRDLDLSVAGTYSQAPIAGDAGTDYSFDGTVYAGIFDGNGKTISNLNIVGSSYCGLFGNIDGLTAEVKGLGVNFSFSNSSDNMSLCGGLCGTNNYGTITNCHATGRIYGGSESDYLGGICGKNIEGYIVNSYSVANIYGDDNIGGFCGYNSKGVIRNCFSFGSVTCGNQTLNMGGFCGFNLKGEIANCYTTVSVLGTALDRAGAFCGANSAGVLRSSFWNVDTSVEETGYNEYGQGQGTIENVSGITTAEMRVEATFSTLGWDFEATWQMSDVDGEFNGYPVLMKPRITGLGTADDPFLIENIDNFNEFCSDTRFWASGVYTKLTSDLDLRSAGTYSQAPIAGDTDEDIVFDGTKFSGNFSGDGHVISNLAIDGSYYCGLFGSIDINAVITNLGLKDVSIIGTGDEIGGLVGMSLGVINSCYSTGSVTGSYSVGGLAGESGQGGISNCYSSAVVNGRSNVGGLVGVGHGSICNCYSTGVVTGEDNVGGLVGYNYGIISNCYSTGTIAGGSYVGGLTGYSWQGSINNCYSTGTVTGSYRVGGLVGQNPGSITACYFNSETCGISYSDGGWPLTDSEMKQASSFYGWTNGNWTIDEGNDYPHLLWENAGGEIINTDYPAIIYAGEGTEQAPYELASAEDILCLMYREIDWDKHYVLTADINLSGQNFSHPLIGYITEFSGTFDGNNHVIRNFTISVIRYCGMFGRIDTNAVITNLGLEDITVTCLEAHAGILAGGSSGSISNCYSTGTVTGEDESSYGIGGLVGDNHGSIINCYSTGTVTGEDEVGGLVASSYGSISNCYSTGTVTGEDEVGGLVASSSGSISNCYSTGSVTGSGRNVGGLVGRSSGSISNCYSTGVVTGEEYVGGLCGDNENGIISNCYSMGSVTGENDVGGLVGRSSASISNCYSTGSVTGEDAVGGLVGESSASISNCYSLGTVTGSSRVGGLVGDNYSCSISNCFWDVETSGNAYSDGGVGLSTAEMQTRTTYTDSGWDFVGETNNGIEDIWIMDGYPVFSWQYVGLGGGNGTESDPYLIDNIDDFNEFCSDARFWASGVYTKLTHDLDLGEVGTYVQAPIAGDDTELSFNGIKYSGNFNGDGHVISNLKVDGTNYCGLFGSIDTNGVIANLGLEDFSIIGAENIIGGLAGECLGVISNCYSTGVVTGEDNVGGLVGYNYGIISNCYSTGTIAGGSYVGGLTGYSWQGSINNCYSTGTVTGSYRVGGLVGYNSGSVTACFFDAETCGVNYSDGGRSLTDIKMKQASSFYGWTNGNWTIEEGTDYPHLFWENAGGEIINTDYPAVIYAGEGTEQAPYELANVEDILCLMYREIDWDKHYVLTADIDLSGQNFNHPLIGYITEFTGSFEGSNYVISNLTITGISYCGLFGCIGEDAKITNLGLEDADVTCIDQYAGGIAGYSWQASISNCYSTGFVTGDRYVGGLVGYSEDCSISNCYSTGVVTGEYYVGGLVGYSEDCSISNCYSTRVVTGEYYVGGLVGDNYSCSISNCFWDVETSGTTDSDGGTGISTAEMRVEKIYTDSGWDFIGETDNGIEDIWMMDGYPVLSWQYKHLGNGDGTEDTPYVIRNEQGFTEICSDPNYWASGVYVKLSCDLDMSGAGTLSQAPIAGDTDTDREFDGIAFEGFFDGNGYTIRNLKIEGTYYCGFFGKIGAAGTVANLNVEADIEGTGDYVGKLCGYNDYGNIINCSVGGYFSVRGYYNTGGICGYNNYGNITNCNVTDTVLGGTTAGGICGRNEYGVISNCYSTNEYISSNGKTGGLCGYNNGGVIDNCYSTANVNGYGYNTGGLCGSSSGEIIDCYASNVYVIGEGYDDNLILEERGSTGGLCGLNEFNGVISNSYAEGQVLGYGRNTGGLCGYNYNNVVNCYATGEVKSEGVYANIVGGLCGYNNGTINNSYATGPALRSGEIDIHSWSSVDILDYYIAGGLCGYNRGDLVSCYASGMVNGGCDSAVTSHYSGGLCGYNENEILNCYATGDVNGDSYCSNSSAYSGGLCGKNSDIIRNCYATGAVRGVYYENGICGQRYAYAPDIINSFWDVETSDIGASGDDNFGAIGKATAEMQDLDVFLDAGWDFNVETDNGSEDIWHMPSGAAGYPMLWWQRDIAGDIAGGYGVDMADTASLAEGWMEGFTMADLVEMLENWLAGKVTE